MDPKLLSLLPRLAWRPYHIPYILEAYHRVADHPIYRWLFKRVVAGISAQEQKILRTLTYQPIDISYLKGLPPHTFGYQYQIWMEREGLDASFYVKLYPTGKSLYERDWISMRFAKTHDFHHALLGLSGNLEDEIGLQIFNLLNFREPGAAFTAFAFPYVLLRYRMSPWNTALRSLQCAKAAIHMESLMTFPFELHYETPMIDLRRRFGIGPEGLGPIPSFRRHRNRRLTR